MLYPGSVVPLAMFCQFLPSLGPLKYSQRHGRPFRGPWRSSEGPKGPDLVPTATGWSNWVNHIHIMCSGPLWDLYGTPVAPKRAHFGPERPFWEPRRSSVGPGGSDLVPTAAVWSTWVGLMATTHLGLVSGLFRAPGGSKRAPLAQNANVWPN